MRNYQIGLESIAVQSDVFFNQLTENIAFLRNDGRYTTPNIKESGVMENIFMQTGLKVNFIVQDIPAIGAYVVLPNVDRNHPFIRSDFRNYLSNDVGKSALQFKDATPKGTVNTKTSRVSGWFSEVACDLVVSTGLLKAKDFTHAEIAAIVLHELGHLFTYWLHLGNTVVSNLYTMATARRIVGVEDYGERLYMLKEAERTLGVELPDKEQLAKITSDKESKGIQTVMLTSLADKSRNETGFNFYEMRSCEQIADQFAVKHGAGTALASALDRVYRVYGHRSYRNRMVHVFFEVGKLFMFCLGLMSLSLTLPLLLYVFLTNPLEKQYDDPKQRLQFIRSTLIEEIKERKLPEERRKQLVNDVEMLDQLIAQVDDKATFFELFWTYCRSEGSAAAKQEKLAKTIQELTANGLFLSASQFALLK